MRILILFTILLIGLPINAFAQEEQSDPPYGMTELEAYSLFYENYRNEDFEMAKTYGEWILEALPNEIEGHADYSLETQFVRFINVYANLAEEETDPSEEERFMEKAIGIFDDVREIFDEDEIDRFEWVLREGRFYQENHQHFDNGAQKAFDMYERAFDKDPERFAEESDGFYVNLLLDNYIAGDESEAALRLIEEVEPHASPELSEAIEEAQNLLFDEPEERVVFLEDQLEGAGADEREVLLSELAELYDSLGNREKALDTAERLYEKNPDFDNTLKLAELVQADAEYELAIDYFAEAKELSPDESETARIALEIADAYQNLDDLQAAREYARSAIDNDPENGDAYLRMSSIYAAAVSECSANRDLERNDRTVYWLVLDYLERAKEVDPATASTANQRIESYEEVVPGTEDKFFMGWEEGEPFQIDEGIGECYAWINEETIVR